MASSSPGWPSGSLRGVDVRQGASAGAPSLRAMVVPRSPRIHQFGGGPLHGIVFDMDTETAHLICLRHAEAHSRAGCQRGAPLDPPLTRRGQEQAAAVADQLGDRRARMIFASDARRSRETAAIIAAALGLHVALVAALSEVAIPAEVLRAWIVDGDLSVRVADGETGR